MKELDTHKKAKQLAEFITPKKLREFLSTKVTKKHLKVLEPAIGSGQLIFEIIDKIENITGFDVNSELIEILKENFGDKLNFNNNDFIKSEIAEHFDLAISNYPFSLTPSEEQKQSILKDPFLSQFYSGKVTGKLDIIFILKSFNVSDEGLYLCFPGIGYRDTETKFREYIIKNKFLVEFGLLENCKFEHTTISILFIHLNKNNQNKSVNSFRLDLETGEKYNETVDKFDEKYSLSDFPSKPIEKEIIDPVKLEMESRKQAEKYMISQIKISELIWEIDESIRVLPSVEKWVEQLTVSMKGVF
jgi:hypothetical protein